NRSPSRSTPMPMKWRALSRATTCLPFQSSTRRGACRASSPSTMRWSAPSVRAGGSACRRSSSRSRRNDAARDPPPPSPGAAAALEIFGIPRYVTVPLVAAGIWALVVFAGYRLVERVFLSVAVVFLAYVVSAFVAGPNWGEVGRALVTPSVSFEPSTLLLMVATVGTTVTPYMFFYLQSSVADKGLGPEELPLERADAILGGVWTNVI